jgi:hypothetical protein
MVEFDPESVAAVDALHPIEVGWVAEVEGGADRSGHRSPPALDLAEVGSVEEHA